MKIEINLAKELLEEIKDDKFEKEQLEDFYSSICQFRSDVSLEMADLLKKEAIFMGNRGDRSIPIVKADWRATEDGQRLVDLKALKSALSDAKDGIKNRIWAKLS